MGSKDSPPKWIKSLLEEQTKSLKSIINDALVSKDPTHQPKKRKSSTTTEKTGEWVKIKQKTPKQQISSHESDDFDTRFGHLIGLNVNDNEDDDEVEDDEDENNGDENNNDEDNDDNDNDEEDEDDDEAAAAAAATGQDDLNESIDEDLVEILDSTPNWEPNTSLKKFITKTCDHALPDEILKKLNDDYVPQADLVEYFLPPKMPTRLMISISRMKSKTAVKTERAMYNAQKELFITAKPLLSALMDLKPLGEPVSKAREKLSISLQGIYSVSIKISRARRENVRFLFKFALAEVLYSFDPTHSSLFGGSSFSSQVEKAVKEAKLDLTWSKPKSKTSFSFQPFQAYGQGGFSNRGRGRGRFQQRRGRFQRRPYSNYKQQDSKPKYPKGSQSKE